MLSLERSVAPSPREVLKAFDGSTGSICRLHRQTPRCNGMYGPQHRHSRHTPSIAQRDMSMPSTVRRLSLILNPGRYLAFGLFKTRVRPPAAAGYRTTVASRVTGGGEIPRRCFCGVATLRRTIEPPSPVVGCSAPARRSRIHTRVPLASASCTQPACAAVRQRCQDRFDLLLPAGTSRSIFIAARRPRPHGRGRCSSITAVATDCPHRRSIPVTQCGRDAMVKGPLQHLLRQLRLGRKRRSAAQRLRP